MSSASTPPPPQRKRARTSASTSAMISQALPRSRVQQDSFEPGAGDDDEAAKSGMRLKKGRSGGTREQDGHGEVLGDVMVVVGGADSGNSSVTASASELLQSGTDELEDCVDDDTSLDSDADVDVAKGKMIKIKVRRRPGLTETDREVVRLICQHLNDIGLVCSAKVLLTEAGVDLNHRSAESLRNDVLAGDWTRAVRTLEALKCHLENPNHLVEMKFLLFEQKYLELLSLKNRLGALKVLQTELTPLRHNQARLHELSSFLMLTKSADLARVTRLTNGKMSRLDLVERLQMFLPASVMLPPRRLMTLLSQAQELQEERCVFHNQALSTQELNYSCLATDHQCSARDIPSKTLQVLSDHLEEVWYCQFSPDGLKLATGSKDATVMIYEMDPITLEFKRSCTLELPTRSAHDLSRHGIACFAWNPDSTRLAVCGAEDCDEVVIFDVETGQKDARIQQSHEDALTTVCWSPDGNKIACGGTKGNFYQCDSKGTIVDAWEGIRVVCLQYRGDGRSILAADTHNRIRQYNFDDLTDTTILQEDNGIMSFSIDATDRYAVLNVATQGLHMWDIEGRCLVRRFVGMNQGHYTLYSCFGGLGNNFIASGSEESKVFIYQVQKESPVAVLRGHTRTVNCVAWNPVYNEILVSASDDGTVRVWGSPKDEKSVYINGQTCENGFN